MLWMFLALALSLAALALGGYELVVHLRSQPANDTERPLISERLRTRMRLGALLLGLALLSLWLAQGG